MDFIDGSIVVTDHAVVCAVTVGKADLELLEALLKEPLEESKEELLSVVVDGAETGGMDRNDEIDVGDTSKIALDRRIEEPLLIPSTVTVVVSITTIVLVTKSM